MLLGFALIGETVPMQRASMLYVLPYVIVCLCLCLWPSQTHPMINKVFSLIANIYLAHYIYRHVRDATIFYFSPFFFSVKLNLKFLYDSREIINTFQIDPNKLGSIIWCISNFERGIGSRKKIDQPNT